jgi:hypothetical protein
MTNDSDATSEKIDYLFRAINRYDLYMNSTNSKASLILAWNGFVLSFVLLKYDSIITNFPQTRPIIILTILLLTLIGISSLISSVQAFRVVFPYLKSGNENSSSKNTSIGSMIFFGSVASMSPDEFYSRVSASSINEWLLDITEQSVILARGTKMKMHLVRSSIKAVGCELFCFLALLALKAIVT